MQLNRSPQPPQDLNGNPATRFGGVGGSSHSNWGLPRLCVFLSLAGRLILGQFFFWTAEDEGTLNHKSKNRYPTGAATQAKRSSRTTSFPEGMEAPVPGLGRLSRRDRAKAPPCAARQDGAPPPQPRGLHSVLQQKWHRLCLRLRKASEEMGRLIGPPTPSLSSQHHQTGSSALSHQLWVCGLFPSPRFLQRATPARLSAPLLGLPSRRRGDINVVSTASWAPCHKVNPSAMITSILRPSRPLKAPTSSSRTQAFGVTLAPASRHTWDAAHSTTPAFPKPLPRSTLLDDGQTGRVGGHIGMCERARARASGGVCTAGCGKVGPQFTSSCWWASS